MVSLEQGRTSAFSERGEELLPHQESESKGFMRGLATWVERKSTERQHRVIVSRAHDAARFWSEGKSPVSAVQLDRPYHGYDAVSLRREPGTYQISLYEMPEPGFDNERQVTLTYAVGGEFMGAVESILWRTAPVANAVQLKVDIRAAARLLDRQDVRNGLSQFAQLPSQPVV